MSTNEVNPAVTGNIKFRIEIISNKLNSSYIDTVDHREPMCKKNRTQCKFSFETTEIQLSQCRRQSLVKSPGQVYGRSWEEIRHTNRCLGD